MKAVEKNMPIIEEIKEIIIREKGDFFWKELMDKIEQNQRKNFMDGYKYAIHILEDGLVRK